MAEVAGHKVVYLNGGPWAGCTAVLPCWRMIYEYSPEPDQYYQVRLGVMGVEVPHDLESIEFDWRPDL